MVETLMRALSVIVAVTVLLAHPAASQTGAGTHTRITLIDDSTVINLTVAPGDKISIPLKAWFRFEGPFFCPPPENYIRLQPILLLSPGDGPRPTYNPPNLEFGPYMGLMPNGSEWESKMPINLELEVPALDFKATYNYSVAAQAIHFLPNCQSADVEQGVGVPPFSGRYDPLDVHLFVVAPPDTDTTTSADPTKDTNSPGPFIIALALLLAFLLRR